ncbi:hypothetical protein Tco_0869367 [Tanacetum coccineum]
MEMVVKSIIMWKTLYGEATEVLSARVTKGITTEVKGDEEANKSASKERYREAKKEVKKAVSRAKGKAYDLGRVRFIKDEEGRRIINEDAVRRR